MFYPLFITLFSLFSFGTNDDPIKEICVSSEEKKLFEIINDYRKEKKLSAIPYSAKLTKVARAHAMDLAKYYDLNNSDGCNPHSWSTNGMWTSCCYTNDHKAAQCMWDKPKEIAGYDGHGYEIAYYSSAGANATEGLTGWKKSPHHHAMIINTGMWKQIDWKAIGVGIYREYAVVWFGANEDDSTVKVCE